MGLKILFPYMARWHAVNWTRYHSLLTALADKGCEVHVLQPPPLLSHETNFLEIEEVPHPGIVVTTVPVNQTLWGAKLPLEKLFKKAFYCLRAYRYAREYVRRQKIDVVMLYNIPQYQFMNLPGVIRVFDYADDYLDMLQVELGRASNPIALALAGRMLRRMLADSELTLSVSHELAKDQAGNIHVLPNGVSIHDCNKVAWQQPARAPVVGFIGSFEYFIDFDVIIGAARALPSVTFLLVGRGRDFERVQGKIRQQGLANVVLTGGVPHSEVFEKIRSMDICLNIFKPIPTSHRACPIKLFEYMSQCKPVISSRLHELAHIDNDFLYYADNTAELIAAIKQILEGPAEAANRASRGYQETVEKYTWENIADRFIALVGNAG